MLEPAILLSNLLQVLGNKEEDLSEESSEDSQVDPALEELKKMREFIDSYTYSLEALTYAMKDKRRVLDLIKQTENRALSFYKIKEYYRSLKQIVESACKFVPITNLQIKLLIANLQGLGFLGIASYMYEKCAEQLGGEWEDCYYFAGLCAYLSNEHGKAKGLLFKFIQAHKDNKDEKVKSLIQVATNLLKEIVALENTSSS